MNITRKVAELTKPFWPRIFGAIILGLAASGITAAIAWLVKPALDQILVEKKYEYITFIPAGIILLFVVKGLMHFAEMYLMHSAGLKLIREMRNRLYNHILNLPLGYFSRESSGMLLSRIINDVTALKGLVSTVVRTFVVEIPTVLFLLGVAFYRRWDLSLLILVLIPFLAFSTRKFGKSVKKKQKHAQRRISVVTHKISEAILGNRIIKIFNRHESMATKFRSENQGYYREMLRVMRLKEFTKLVIDAATGIGVAAALWYGFSLVSREVITTGDLGSILVAIYMVFTPVKKIGDGYNTLQEIRASLERIDSVFETNHEKGGNIKIREFRDSIRFQDVHFSYPGGGDVLNSVNLEIKKGEIIAIVGRSGAGKSTIVDLIPGFIRPTAGRLIIDDTDISDAELYSLRDLMGIVSQETILFNDTVRENIAFGKTDATDEEIYEAARLAYADEFIGELPDQYETVVGDRGLNLSGGQRQRLAIARAVLKNPPILILDEATSSLDSVSEAFVQKALEKLMKGRTTIVIAHRLSTIRNADRIVILEDGKITDSGTHEQLIARSETYMKLYNAFALS